MERKYSNQNSTKENFKEIDDWTLEEREKPLLRAC